MAGERFKWTVRAIEATPTGQGKVIFLKDGSEYGQLFLNVPLEELAFYPLGKSVEITITVLEAA